MTFLRNMVVLAAGVLLAASIVPGIEYNDNWMVLSFVVLILAFLNAVMKPLLVLLTLPFVILSFGLGIWLINAFLLHLASVLVDGFEVSGLGAALLGSLVISLTNMLLNGGQLVVIQRGRRGHTRKRHDDDVIDV
ncbi:MAG: phage holin family protein [Opitutales bacterium]|nr:phage holin family protein [Opitutales bacterium]